MEISVVSIIQAMLAPGIMISACALLLLGVNNKYSMVVNRIRALDDEKRKLKALQTKVKLSKDEENRLQNISIQIHKFARRFLMIRNTVICYLIAIGFFILACLSIGLQFALKNLNISGVVSFVFLTGIISVFIGIMYAAREASQGYEIVMIEIKEED